MRNLTKISQPVNSKEKRKRLYSRLCFRLALSPLCRTFDTVSSNINKVLLVNSPANVFISEDFNVYQEDW